MRLVVDANILVAELIRERGRKLIARPELELYSDYEAVARNRIPRDPNDWFTVALALVLVAAIWTSDHDFLGCGIATWTTDTLLICLT